MTTTYKDISDAILARVNSNLTTIDAAYTATDVRWPAGIFEPKGNSWMAVDVDFTEARQQGLQSPNRRIDGFLFFQLFQRVGVDGLNGQALLMARLDGARDLFPLGQTLAAGGDNLRFKEPVPSLPSDEGPEWMPQALRCPFYLFTG